MESVSANFRESSSAVLFCPPRPEDHGMTCHNLKPDRAIAQLTSPAGTLTRDAKGHERHHSPRLYELLTDDSCPLNEFSIFPVKTIEFQYMNYRHIYICTYVLHL